MCTLLHVASPGIQVLHLLFNNLTGFSIPLARITQTLQQYHTMSMLPSLGKRRYSGSPGAGGLHVCFCAVFLTSKLKMDPHVEYHDVTTSAP
jgi:hypothetical protein